MRGRFEGTLNVVRFNWTRYALGGATLVTLLACTTLFARPYSTIFGSFAACALLLLILPVIASYWIYDRSDLYSMPWLKDLRSARVLNMTAGFDETSQILHTMLNPDELVVVDFYDQARHTEASIARARERYPAFPGTVSLHGASLPYADQSFDLVVGFLALHEVRSHQDRVALLLEMRRTVSEHGWITITEHHRDLPNALVFSFGVLHFLSTNAWLVAFKEAGLSVEKSHRTTPFITTYMLKTA